MLRPIDLTMTIQGAAEVQRAGKAGADVARPEIASQLFADRLEKQARLQEQQVNQTEATDKDNVNPDKEGHADGYQGNRGKKKKPESNKPAPSKPRYAGESLYDIKI